MGRIQVARSCSAPAPLVCLLAIVAAYPSSAVAAGVTTRTAESPFEELVFRADLGELNDVLITRDAGGLYRITDRGSPIDPGDQCAAVDARQVMCPPADWVRIELADGDDRIEVDGGDLAGRFLILGGTGRDSIQLSGSPAASGTPGEADTDFVRGGRFRGPYSVDAGEDDDVVGGSAADDVLVGGPGRDALAGGGGDDLVSGGTGEDLLGGGDGGDLLVGGDLALLRRGAVGRDEFDALEGDAGDDLLAGGPGPDRLTGGSDNDSLFYARPRGALSVTFDGQANDGPPGEGDDVGSGEIEGALLAQSGRLALSGSLGFGGGRYTLAGGRATSASVVMLSSTGTGGDSMEGRFSGTAFSVRLINPGGSLATIEARGGNRSRCRRASSSQGDFSAPRAEASYLSLRRILARIRARRRGGAASAAGVPRAFRVVGRASSATATGRATWLTTDTCKGTLTQVKSGNVMLKSDKREGLTRRTIRRLRGRARGRFRTLGQESSAFVRG